MKFLKNSKYYFIALLASCLMACSDDEKKGNDPDDTGDYTSTPLSPDENKAKLETIGKDFVAKINASDHKEVTTSLQELYDALDNSNFDEFLPDYLQNNDEEVAPPIYPALLSEVIKHNDANALMELATRSFDDAYRVSDFQGIYTYNEGKWSKAPAENKVEFHYGKSVLAIVCTNIKEYTKVNNTLIEVPGTTTVTLNVNGKNVLGLETKITLSSDMYSADIESTLTLADNYIWKVTASAKSEKATAHFQMTVKDEELINGTAELSGTNLTNPDYIDKNGKDIFNTGNFDCQIMNLRLKGEGDIKAIIKGKDKIDNQNYWESNYDEAQDKKNAETLRDLYNSYLKIQGFYVAEKQKFADIKMGIYSTDENQYIWNSNKENYDTYPVKDWDIQPIIVFGDNSEMECESFFTEARFSSLISSVETLVNKYMDILGKDHVEL